MNIGVVGCGMISDAYLQALEQFDGAQVLDCADLNQKSAQAQADKYGLRAVTVEMLMENKDIDIVLNLTPPAARTSVNLQALEAGKHVYCEKPFALTVEDARKTLDVGIERNLLVCGAPDSFLGGTQQTARALIDAGKIGEIKAGTAAIMLFCGRVSNHPNLGFFFQKGGGPLFDMGPYYISSLVNLIGPVVKVAAMSTRAFDERICIGGINKGKTYPVEVETHIGCLLEFKSGAIVTLNTSFDVWKHSNPRIELHGTKGSLQLPEPSGFGGELKLCEIDHKDWQTIPSSFKYNTTARGLGLMDMIESLRENKEPRCSGAFAAHVLEVMCSLDSSAKEGSFISIESTCERRMPMLP